MQWSFVFKQKSTLTNGVFVIAGMQLIYSTPRQYINALHALNQTWTLKTDDIFPYADSPHSYWTGYFTSRQALKGYERMTSARLHAAQKLYTTGGLHCMNICIGTRLHHVCECACACVLVSVYVRVFVRLIACASVCVHMSLLVCALVSFRIRAYNRDTKVSKFF